MPFSSYHSRRGISYHKQLYNNIKIETVVKIIGQNLNGRKKILKPVSKEIAERIFVFLIIHSLLKKETIGERTQCPILTYGLHILINCRIL